MFNFSKRINNSDFIIFIMTLGTFSILSTELGFIGILPEIARFFSVSVDQSGIFLSGFSIIIAFCSLFVPVLVSGINRRYLFITVLGVMSLFSFIGGVVSDFYVALACRLIPAFFYPAFVSIAFSTVGDIVEPDQIPIGVSKIVMGVSAGSILGVPISTVFANYGGYPAAMFWFGLVNLIMFIITVLFFPSIEGHDSSNLVSQFAQAKRGIFWISCIGIVLLAGGFNVFYSYISVFLEVVSGIVGSNLSLCLFIFGIMSIPGSWVAGRLLVKYPFKTVLVYPFILCMVFGLFYLFGSGMIPTFVIMALFGFIEGIFNNIIQFWIYSAMPSAPEFANGVFMSMLNIGITIGTSIGGYLIVTGGIMNLIGCGMIIALMAFVLFVLRFVRYERV